MFVINFLPEVVMDFDILVEKLKDFFKFLIVIVAILGIARYTGYLDGFTPDDFKAAYNKIFVTKAYKYNGYLLAEIPQNAKKSAIENRCFVEELTSSKKTILIIYGNSAHTKFTSDVYNNIQNYINKSSLRYYYDLYGYSYSMYKNLRVGVVSSSDICNSIKECKAQRDHAADWTSLQALIEKCTKSVCIFNPPQNQYIIIRKNDYQSIVKVLNDLKNW